MIYPLILQAVPSSPMELITSSTGATKFVLGILVVLSLISWGIIFAKWAELRRAARITYSFAHEFAGAHSVEAAAQMARGTNGPPARIMERATRFIAETTPALRETSERAARFSGSQVQACSYMPRGARGTVFGAFALMGLLGIARRLTRRVAPETES